MKKLFQKLLNRETVLYLVFGVLTTLVNFLVFDRLNAALGEKYVLVSETAAFVAAVLFAFSPTSPSSSEARTGPPGPWPGRSPPSSAAGSSPS